MNLPGIEIEYYFDDTAVFFDQNSPPFSGPIKP